MKLSVDIRIYPTQLDDEDFIKGICARELDITTEDITQIKIVKKSIDSRGRRPKYVLRIQVGTIEKPIEEVTPCLLYTSPSPRDRTRSRMPSSA